MIEAIIVLLLIFWLLGWIGNIGGNLIHIILVIAAVVLIFRIITGRRVV